mmetsp:Transcript_25153/g.25508  ORF Transcript_25153/g.25508 Transcript_25153/m.25508 type:complete len:248 (+) Transcript_25153:85-828(+)
MHELEGMSDDVFASPPVTLIATTVGSSWGSINGNNKRKLDRQDTSNNEDDDNNLPATKKLKLDDGNKVASNNSTKKKKALAKATIGDDENRTNIENNPSAMSDEFLYIPSFYPRPPSTKVLLDERRTVVDDQQQRILQQQRQQQQQQEQQVSTSKDLPKSLADQDSSQGVRSSLVRMDQNNYWGSGWDQTSTLAVPMGRRMNAVGGNTNLSGGATAAAEVPIIPLNRASGSTVSRILEGSMDAAAMQ